MHVSIKWWNLRVSQIRKRCVVYLQDIKSKKAVEWFEGMRGGVRKAMRLLEVCFGQPHMMTKACVEDLVEGPNISNSDREGLREFADRSRILYETSVAMNALSEMNLTKLGKMEGRSSTDS